MSKAVIQKNACDAGAAAGLQPSASVVGS